MFKIVLMAVALHYLGPMAEPPDLHGLATRYGPPAFCQGDTMANGEPLDLDAPTVAVDVSLREWLNCQALILTECGTLHRVKVTDTGRLYEVGGWFRLGERGGTPRYWPVLEGIETDMIPVITSTIVGRGIRWQEDRAYQVVADFPRDFFTEIACQADYWGRGDTMKVWIWKLD